MSSATQSQLAPVSPILSGAAIGAAQSLQGLVFPALPIQPVVPTASKGTIFVENSSGYMGSPQVVASATHPVQVPQAERSRQRVPLSPIPTAEVKGGHPAGDTEQSAHKKIIPQQREISHLQHLIRKVRCDDLDTRPKRLPDRSIPTCDARSGNTSNGSKIACRKQVSPST